ncbi:MAG: sigma-70 family RNA polymerase sigma factor [Planctomycetes bacterium]|nr:sigma-70 family RNA polymerase sigma factor [Planctomycetota bacterium]
MTTLREPDTEELLDRAGQGDREALQQLLARHRVRLRQMVSVRLDRRLAARVDPSDVVQEALAEASRKLDDYLQRRPLPFYPWLRQIAWQRLVHLTDHHLRAQRRTVTREVTFDLALPDESAHVLAGRLVSSGTSPSRSLLRKELRARVQAALAELPARDREVLVLRYLEELSNSEIAAVLAITEAAVKMRHVRALDRLRGLLDEELAEDL